MEKEEKKIIHSHLDYDKSPLISEGEIISQLTEEKGPSLFLGRYTLREVIAVLKKRNLIQYGIKKGFTSLIYELDSKDYPTQRFRIYSENKKPGHLLVDLKIREGKARPKKDFSFFPSKKEYDFLIIEWLTLQNPLEKFTQEKPRLPGQVFPGLGLAKKVLDVFIYLARLMRKDGILIYPWYFHNALMYLNYFYFFNPKKQGEVIAIKKKFSDVEFVDLAWIVYLGCMKYKNRKAYKWFAEEQIYPLKEELKNYFKSKNYKSIVNRTEKKLEFLVDWDCYFKKRNIKQEGDPHLYT